jgi:hypothetical protein
MTAAKAGPIKAYWRNAGTRVKEDHHLPVGTMPSPGNASPSYLIAVS